MSRQVGQRFGSLRAIREAMQLPVPEGHTLNELRTEAIAALCLPDFEVAKEWDGSPPGSSSFTIDTEFQRYARADKDGNVTVRRIEGDEELFALPGVGPSTAYDGLRFSPDGPLPARVIGTVVSRSAMEAGHAAPCSRRGRPSHGLRVQSRQQPLCHFPP